MNSGPECRRNRRRDALWKNFEISVPIIKSIVFAVIVLIVGLLLIKWINRLVRRLLDKKDIAPSLKPFIKSVISVALKGLLIVAVISILGIETSSFVALFGTAGLAHRSGVSGLLVKFCRRCSDFADQAVQGRGLYRGQWFPEPWSRFKFFIPIWLPWTTRSFIFPNGGLANTSVVNHFEKPTRRVDLDFRVAYEADIDHVIRVLTGIIENHPLALKTPEPLVRLAQHAESGMIYAVRVWVDSANYWQIRFDVIEQVKQRFDEEGIVIPLPTSLDIQINQ